MWRALDRILPSLKRELIESPQADELIRGQFFHLDWPEKDRPQLKIAQPQKRGVEKSMDRKDAATDAANYPCPPTPAQVAVGDTCGFVVAAHPSDLDVVPISFRS